MSFQLTSHGETAAQNINIKQNLESKVLTYLYQVGKPTELDEIQDETRLSDEKTVQLLRRMVNKGYVEEV